MEYLYAGLAGVVVGALLATVIVLFLIQKRIDRDLIERRLRACLEYRECLKALGEKLDKDGSDPRVVEQAWWSVRDFCREFHLTSWLLESAVRERLERLVAELEEEWARYDRNGHAASGRAAQILCGKYHEIDRVLARETKRQAREFQRFRFLPAPGARERYSESQDE